MTKHLIFALLIAASTNVKSQTMRATKVQAIELKAAGYDAPCRDYYHPHNGLSHCSEADNYNRNAWAKGYYSAPTLEAAAQWLRTTKRYHITVTLYNVDLYEASVTNIDNLQQLPCGEYFDSYDAALSAAVDRALGWIKDISNE